MLHQRYSLDDLAGLLIPRADYRPHPTIEDRAAWEGLPAAVRQAHLDKATPHIGFDYPSLPATLFLQYSRMGNRSHYEKPHFVRRGVVEMLVTAECMEGKGRFLDDIANGIWAICEETYWGVPAHIRVQRAGNTLPDAAEPTVDLFAAETGNLMAWTYYLLGERLDAVSPLVRERMSLELERRILTPLYERNDFWWMGFHLRADQRRVNNWNPWICSNWLSVVLLMETDERRRQETVHKIMRSLDNFIDPYPTDGGCDEGPSYWGRAGASLFDNLELFYSASNGQIDLYNEPLIQEIGRFVYRVHIDEDYSINFADAPALVYPDGVLVYRYGQRIGDPAMLQHGLWLIDRQGTRDEGYSRTGYRRPLNFQRLLRGLSALNDLPAPGARPPQVRDVWLPVIEVMVARDKEGCAGGFFVGAKGGHNAESHNHNDIGTFVVYRDGKPLLVDAGVETYTAKTFGPQRYEIWTMQSAYHNLLPAVDGAMQLPGFDYRAVDTAYAAGDAAAQLSLDIAHAYGPEAKIASWRRTVRLNRGLDVVVNDDYALTAPVGTVTVSLITPCAVDVSQPGVVKLGERAIRDGRVSASGQVAYDPEIFSAALETILISDERMGGAWGREIYRVVLTATNPAPAGTWTYRVE